MAKGDGLIAQPSQLRILMSTAAPEKIPQDRTASARRRQGRKNRIAE
jgi:hypothetical protein